MSNAEPIILKDSPSHMVWKKCFATEAAKSRIKRRFPRQFHEVLPGFSTADRKFHDLLRYIADEASARIDHGHESGFVLESGVPGDFQIIRTLSGYGAAPSGHVLYDNALLAKSNEVESAGFRRREHKQLFDEVIECMFTYGVYGSLKVAAKSSQGLPKVTFDKDEKVRDAIALLSRENLDTLFACLEKGRGDKLLSELGIVMAYLQNFRLSADKPTKQRLVPSLEYAVSGGQSGERVVMDKTITLKDGHTLEGIGACRSRNVMGMSNPINIVISTFRSATAKHYLKEYEFTWHDTGLTSLCDRLSTYLNEYPEGELVGIDVTQFDSNVRDWMQLEKWNVIRDKGAISDRFAELCYKSGKAPVFQSDVGDNVGPVFHGDPLKMELLPSPGILSGHDMVSPDGKFFNVWNNLCVLGETVGFDRLIGKVHKFLKGELPWRLLNAGDDGILMLPNKALVEAFFKNASKGYFKIDREDALTYKGFVFRRQGNVVEGYNNVISLARNTWVPERAWDSKLRAFWFIGLGARFDVYSNNPSLQSLLDVFDDGIKKIFPEKGTYRGLVEYWIERNRHNLPNSQLSTADLLFLENPDVIHYRISADDVSQDLLEASLGSIPLEAYKHMIGTDLLLRPSHHGQRHV